MRVELTSLWWAMTLVAVACAPPDPVDLPTGTGTEEPEPSLRLLYPENGQTIEIEADCSVHQLFVSDVEDFEFTPVQLEEAEATGRKGHLHLFLGQAYIPAGAPTFEAEFDCTTVRQIGTAGNTFARAELHAQGSHDPLDQWAEWDDEAEIVISDPNGCLNLLDPCNP